MFKAKYLITFLSVLLMNSKTSFGQGLKKELGICGKTMSSILKIAPDHSPELVSSVTSDLEFCDKGRYEQGANFIISLYNKKNELVYDKHIFLNPHVFAETMDSKRPSKVKKVIARRAPNSRIVKFPVSLKMGEVSFYKIDSLEDKKSYELMKINW